MNSGFSPPASACAASSACVGSIFGRQLKKDAEVGARRRARAASRSLSESALLTEVALAPAALGSAGPPRTFFGGVGLALGDLGEAGFFGDGLDLLVGRAVLDLPIELWCPGGGFSGAALVATGVPLAGFSRF